MKTFLTFAYISLVCFFQLEAQTTIVLQPHYADGSNTYVRSNFPEIPVIGSTDLTAYAWTCDGDLCTGRAFFKIGLEEIPSGALINSANLHLFANTSTVIGFGGSEPQTGNNDAYVYRVIEDWDHETVTWAIQPEVTTENALVLAESTEPIQDYVLDATLMIQDMVDNPATSFGFTIRLEEEADYYSSLIFASSYHFNEELHPKLVVNYTILDAIETVKVPSFNIFPNPANNNCTIVFNDITTNISEIRICDIVGNEIMKVEVPAGVTHYKCEFENLSTGMYFVYSDNMAASKLQIIR